MVTNFKGANGATYSLVVAPQGRRESEISLDAIKPDPAMLSWKERQRRRRESLRAAEEES